MRKGLWTAVFLAVGVTGAMAQAQYYLRGDFNGWDLSNPMTPMGSGHYMATRTGLTPGSLYEFKVANESWSENAPGSNARTAANANGELIVHLFTGFPFGDGWMPDNNWWRVGYDDPLQFGWDILGSFDGWANPIANMTNMGGGLYMADVAIAPGDYEFKFRKAGDWGVSIGGDFGNGAGNATLHVGASDPMIRFELDLPNGRWRTGVVPEPMTMLGLLVGLGALAARRKK